MPNNYLTDIYPSISQINALVLELGYNPSLMAHSPGHYRVMRLLESSQWLHAEQWLCLALSRWCQDSDGQERDWEEGYVVRRSWQAFGTFPLRRGMKRYLPSCAFHIGASLLSKLLRVVTDTDQTGYKLPTFHLAEKIWWWLLDYSLPGNDASHYKTL